MANNVTLGSDNRRKLYNNLVSDGFDLGSFDDFNSNIDNKDTRRSIYDAAKEAGWDMPDYGQFDKDMNIYRIKVNGRPQEVDQVKYDDFMRRHPNGSNRPQDAQKAFNQVAHNVSPKDSVNAEDGYTFTQGGLDSLERGYPVRAVYPNKPHAAAPQQPANKPQGIGYTAPLRPELSLIERREVERQNNFAARAAERLEQQYKEEENRRNQPMVDTGIESANRSVIKTRGQWEDELNANVKKLGDFITPMVGEAIKKADDTWLDTYTKFEENFPQFDGNNMTAMARANEATDPDKILEGLLGDLKQALDTPEMKKRIKEGADAAGIPVDEYSEQMVAPALMERLVSEFQNTQIARRLPKNTGEYILQGLNNSIIGMLVSGATKTQSQRRYDLEAEAMTEQGQNGNYQPGTGANLARMGVTFAADAPFFGLYGKVGGNVVKSIAERQIKNMVAKGLSEGAARSIVGAALEKSAGTRMKNYIMQHVISGSITMGGFNTTSEAVRQMRDSEFKPEQILTSGLEGVATGAAFGLTGGAAQAITQPLTGIAKVGGKIAGFGAEAETLYATEELAKMAHGEDGFTNPFEGSVEALEKLGVMKLSSGHLAGSAANKIARAKEVGVGRTAAETLAGMLGRTRTGVSFTKEEEAYIRNTVEGKNLIESLMNMHPERAIEEINGKKKFTAEGEQMRQQLANNYDDFMQNSEIPYDVKRKVAATLGGLVPDAAHTPLEVSSDIVHNPDGSVILKTRDKDGNCIRDYKFDSFSDAEGWREAHEEQFRLNDAVNMWNESSLESRSQMLGSIMETYQVDAKEARQMVDAALDGSMGTSFDNDMFLTIYNAIHSNAYPASDYNPKRNYWEGMRLDPEQRHQALEAARQSEETLQSMGTDFADEVIGAADFADEKLAELAGREDITGEQLQAAISYYNWKSLTDGMMDEAAKDVDSQVEAANNVVRRNTHPDTGRLIEAVVDDNDCYVTAGHFTLSQDGRLTLTDNTGAIIVRDKNTGEIHVVSPDKVLVTAINDPQRLIDENNSMEGLRGQLIKQVDDSIELAPGTPDAPQEVGEVFVGADGKQYVVSGIPDEQGNWTWLKIELDADGEPKGNAQPLDIDEYRKAKSDEIDAANRPQPADESINTAESNAEGQNQAAPVPENDIQEEIQSDTKDAQQGDNAGGEAGAENGTGADNPPATAMSRIPVDEKKRPVFEQASPEDTMAALTEKYGEEKAQQMIAKMAENTAKAFEELSKKDTSKMTDMAELAAHEDALAEAEQKMKYWQGFIKKEEPQQPAPAKPAAEAPKQPTTPQQPVTPQQPAPAKPAAEAPQQPAPATTQQPATPQQPAAPNAAERKVYEKQIKKSLGNTFEYARQEGGHVEVTFQCVDHEGKVVSIEQAYDAAGNKVGEPTEKRYDWMQLGKALTEKRLKPVVSVGERLRKIRNVKVGEVPLADVLSEEEQQQLLDAYNRKDKDEISTLEYDLIEAHRKDLILRGRDTRNEKVDRILTGSGTKEEKLKKIRELYKAFDDTSLDNESLYPNTLEEAVAELLGNVPKPGEGTLAYYSYGEGDNKTIGLKDESGYGSRGFSGDTKGFNPWLASNGKGMSLKQFSESLYEQLPEGFKQNITDHDVRNALLSVFGSAEVPSDIPTMVIRRGIIQAENNARRMEEMWIDDAPAFHKVAKDLINDGDNKQDDARETILRDATIEHLQNNGMTVITDVEQGQKALDAYNERVKLARSKKRAVETASLNPKEGSPADISTADGAKIQQNTETNKESEEKINFHKVEAGEKLDELEKTPTVKRYRAMQLIDGKLYPPMSAKVDGEMREPTEIGVWEQSDERPDLIDKNGKFRLNKGQKGQGDVPAAYNPYFHTSTSGLNDQFTSAYKRPELVVVEVEIPESELTSGYKAAGAKDAVGDTPWHSGPVNGQLTDDRKRTVTLSRYAKVTRIVPDSEVADMIAKQLDGTDIEVPYNVVTPQLRKELESRGVKISATPAGTVTEDINGNPITRRPMFHKADNPVFVSNALQAVEGIKQEKGTAEQWLAMIQKNGGLKAGEDKWIGLSDWLNEHKGEKLTKQDVLDYIRQNQIQVQDVNYIEGMSQSSQKKLDALNKEFQELISEGEEATNSIYTADWVDWAYEQMVERYGDDFRYAFDMGEGTGTNTRLTPSLDFNDEISNSAREFLGVDDTNEHPIESTRLRYTTSGLNNKREIALVVPNIGPYNDNDHIHFGDAGAGRAVAWARFGDTVVYDKDATDRRRKSNEEWITFADKMADKYGTDGSMDVTLPLMTDEERQEFKRINADNLQAHEERKNSQQRVLVIDEIQSKRHQDAREFGYQGEFENSPKKKYEVAYDQLMEYKREMDEKYGEYHVSDQLTPEERAKYDELYQKVVALSEVKDDKVYSVPDAPFEKNWQELAMKRMLRYAAENGYDKIAWTTGAQQAERYNLAQAVSSIDTFEPDDYAKEYGEYRNIQLNFRNNSEPVFINIDKDGKVMSSDMDELRGKQLADIVGNELSLKIMQDPAGLKYQGNDLQVGGEGMKGFYDQMLVRFMNKYGKKWGVQVKEIDLPGLEPSAQKMWSIDVTPEMKESVMQGQPMFFKTTDGQAYGYTLDGKIYIDPRIANTETPIHEYGHLWAIMKRQSSPEEWNSIKSALLGDKTVAPIIDKVRDEYPELSVEGREDDFVEEILTQFSGKRGAERLREIADEVAKENGGIFGKAEAVRAMQRLKKILNSFWESVAKMFGVKYRNANDVADMMMKDFLNGVNPIEKVKDSAKQAQLDTILKNNPADDVNMPGHTWIRSVEDIKTFKEALEYDGLTADEDVTPDFTADMVKKALKDGVVTVYSSKPIDNGTFVTPSKMEAQNYAGDGKVYSKEVSLDDVAWIDATQGQYAKVSERAKNHKDIERTLMGVHNISEDKLRKAIKQGGLANPSLAVIDTKNGIHSDYGDISLIPKSSLIDSKTGRNAGTYTGDAYTPTYPHVERMITKQGESNVKRIAKEVAKGDEELERHLQHNMYDYAEGNASRLHLLYLLQKGIKPDILKERTTHSKEEYDAITKIFGEPQSNLSVDFTDEQSKALVDLMVGLYEKKMRESEKPGSKFYERIKQINDQRIEEYRKSLTDDNGRLWFAKGDNFIHENWRDEKRRQEAPIDWYATDNEASYKVATEGLSEDYEKWKEHELFGDGDFDEKLFAGWTPSGNKRYVANTIENASRLMNKESDTNAYDEHGLNATKSSLLKRLTTLSDIRKAKHLLKDKEAYNETQKEMSDELFDVIQQLSDMQVISDNQFMNIDYAEARLQEAITKRDPIEYLNKEFGYDIAKDSEYASQLMNFIEKAKELPAKYFETKFKRPVGLNEFAIAVVPESTSADIVEALRNTGLDVRTYADSGDEATVNENRRRATMDAVQNRQDIMFQIVGKKGATEADKREDSTMRTDNLKVAEEMEAAGKDTRAIKYATGWERGKDGQWRYETVDADVDILTPYNEVYKEMSANVEHPEPRLSLDELLGSDNELFKYYPDLRNTTVKFKNDMPNEIGGSYNGFSISINSKETNRFGNKELDNENVYGILLHEVQHIIQEKEGFAQGGSLSTATSEAGMEAIMQKKEEERKQVLQEINARKRWLSSEEELEKMSQFRGESIEDERNRLHEELDELAVKYNNLTSQIDRIYKLKTVSKTDARDLYHNLAGEVEARNATERMGMSELERRNTPIGRTEDVPRREQVVLTGDVQNGQDSMLQDKSSIQGLDGYTEKDVTDLVEQHFNDLTAGDGLEIVGMKVIGSRAKGSAKEGSDLDVLLEYKGKASEDGLFNLLNDEENRLYIEGIPVDINPITEGKGGTIEQWLKRNEGYNKEAENVSPAKEMSPAERVAETEIGGALVDRLTDMGMDVSTDWAENRRVLKAAEKDNSEAGKLRRFETPDGKTYGFAYKGKVYLDPRKIDAELPIHEYGHIWCGAFRKLNPKGWQDVVNTMKTDADAWEVVKKLNPKLTDEHDIAEEMISKFSGQKGASRLRTELAKMSLRDPSYTGRWGNIFKNISKAIQDFWKQIGDFLHIKYTSPEQVYDQVMKDFAEKVNPQRMVERYLKERDAEYMKAVEAGDNEKAAEIFNEALRENIGNGITPYLSVDKYFANRELAHAVKTRDKKAVAEVAEKIAPLIPKDAVLVPAPSHTGKATDMLDVANAISEITGVEVADVLVGNERGSQYDAKMAGEPISSTKMGIKAQGELPAGKIPVVIDNVVDTGNTAEACVKALGKGIVCTLGDSADRYKHVASLKSAEPVVTNRKGNVVPLSERFEMGGSKYLDKATVRTELGVTSTAPAIQEQEAKVNSQPTEAQKEAGNYQKGHIKLDGYDITIENPKGSVRSGVDAQGNRWETEMHNTYGYIRGTEGVDGDHIDVFLSDDPASGSVFVVDQVNPSTGEFDEHKVMYGFPDMASAEQAYLSNYSKGWKGLGTITPVSREEFKKWVESSHRKTKPFAEYKSVKPQGDVQVGTGDTSEYRRGDVFDIVDDSNERLSCEVVGVDGGDVLVNVDGYGIMAVEKEYLDEYRQRATASQNSEETIKQQQAEQQEATKVVDQWKRANELLKKNGSDAVSQRATKAVLKALDKAGVKYKVVDSKEEKQMLSLYAQMNQNAVADYARSLREDSESAFTRNSRYILYNLDDPFGVPMFFQKQSMARWAMKGVKNLAPEGQWKIIDIGAPAARSNGRTADEESRKAAELMPNIQGMVGWHGSGNKFDHFDHRHMGEGEGNQAYGWGTYITEVEGIGRMYAESMGGRRKPATYKGVSAEAIRHLSEDLFDSIGVANDEQREQLQYIVSSLNYGYGDPVRMLRARRESLQATIDRKEAIIEDTKEQLEEEKLAERVEHMRRSDRTRPIAKERLEEAEKRLRQLNSRISRAEEELEKNKALLDFVNGLDPNDFEGWGQQQNSHLYKVEIPEDTGENYFDWTENVPKERADAILSALKEKLLADDKYGWNENDASRERLQKELDMMRNYFGETFYGRMATLLGNSVAGARTTGKRLASKLLHDNGYIGIKYPAEYRSGGRPDGAKNYVIFDENDAKITGHVEFMQQNKGKQIYGWSDGKSIHLTKAGLNPNTPIHEYTHLWDKYIQESDPELWKKVVSAMKKTDMWQEIRENPGYRNIWNDEDRMASEVHSRLSGTQSEEEFMRAAFKKDTPQAIINEVKSVLRKFWNTLLRLFGKQSKTFGGEYESVDAIIRRPLKDLLEGLNPVEELENAGVNDEWAEPMMMTGEPAPELTPEERQYWNQWSAAMKKWRERNAIPADTDGPGEKPKYQQGQTALDYAKVLMQYNKRRALWETAPKLEDYRQARSVKDAVEVARENEKKYPDSTWAKAWRVSAEMQRIRSAMRTQKQYDKSTVKAVTDLAHDLMTMGFGDNLSRGEMERILSSVKNATGAKDIKKQVDNVMNILIDNQLRNLDQRIVKLSSIKELKQTAQGVEAQGKLELKGQKMIQAFREAREGRMTADRIRERLYEVAERMSNNEGDASMLEQEYEGLMIALQYQENIEGSREEWADLNTEREDAIANYKTSGRSYQAQQELLESLNQAMMENKIERIGMFGEIIGRLEGNISESIQGAKEFVEREKERVKRIHDLANFDTAGKEMGAMRVDKKGKAEEKGRPANFFLQPLGTFEQMLKQFGGRNANGEGYLYDYFLRNWMDATDKAFVNETKAKDELDAKARELFGKGVKRWSDLYEISNKEGAQVDVVDQNEKKTLTLTQGNLLYIYMADKMSDGRMKLRKMGITEEQVEQIKEHLDPRLIQLADWIQDEYLPAKRTEYNKVHERMFGAPMASIEHYFPIKILGDARVQEQDVANMADQDAVLPSTITGNIIKRRRNALPLDILHTDALSLALEHIEDMERWAATAEWNKDINTLLSYTTFRNKVKNMKTIYGSGDELWNAFADTARMAAGTYRPKAKPGSVDAAISNIAKGVTAAKINFRVYTAFKQILSAPAFLHDVNIVNFIKDGLNPYGSWKWAMENMPVFRKRWKSRQIGDTRLMDDPSDWKLWKTNVVQMATRLGMSPNALVDGVTCAVGAKAIYETRYKKYKLIGATDEVARKRALQDAEIGYNLTQQSSEGAFVSKIQKDRTVAANMLTVFRNSSMSYTRQWYDAYRNLRRRMQSGYKEDSIDFMTRQIQEQFNLNETEARQAAEAEYARAGRRDVARMLNMMFGVTIAWNLGASLPYLLMGDDDKTKKEMMTDALLKGMIAGPTEGFAAGNIYSDFVSQATNEGVRNTFKNEGGWGAIKKALDNMGDQDVNPLPLFADMERMIGKMKYDGFAAAQDVFNICTQSAVGVNPQTFTDMWNACMDYGAPGWDGTNYKLDEENLQRPKEIALFIMRLMNAPTSSWRNKYIDELGMDVESAKKLSYEEMAKRYAHYKHWKDVPMLGWLRGEEGRQEKMGKIQDQFDKAVYERVERLTDKELLDNLAKSASYDERRQYAKLIHSRIGGNGKDAQNAKEDWQKNYQMLMQYNDIKEDELLSKKKAEAKANGDTDVVKTIEKAETKIREKGKKKLGGDNDAKVMENIRQWRGEALEKVLRKEQDR